MSPSRNVPEASPRLPRRDFIAYGVGLALLPAVSWAESPSCEGLTVGFCPEAPAGGWLDAEGSPAPSVVPASRLAAGEAILARRGARLTVHGLTNGDFARLGIRSAELLVGFPAPGLEVRTWSHALLPVENEGTPVRFTVPVDGGLRLALELEESLGLARRETVLSVGREPGMPKLRAGHYLVAFDPALPATSLALSVEPA